MGNFMSIYPVKLFEWFPPSHERFSLAVAIVEFSRCAACGKKPRYKAAIGHHSIPYAQGEIWCSWKCCNSGKIAKLDKRRERRMNRRYGDVINMLKNSS